MQEPEVSPSSEGRERRAELRRFLRAHREGLPAPSGAVPGRRRRTPGLRREEVAERAGMSAVWYAWLEMGRPVQVSAKMLERLAVALELTEPETAHLFTLAGRRERLAQAPATVAALPLVQALIDQFPSPAGLLDAQLDLLATNAPYRRVFNQTESLEGRNRNVLWRIFHVPEKRKLFGDWLRQAQDLTSLFRRNYAHHVGNPAFESLIVELSESSPEFRDAWAAQHVMRWDPREFEIDLPDVGRVTMQSIYMTVPWDELQTIVFCHPRVEGGVAAAWERFLRG